MIQALKLNDFKVEAVLRNEGVMLEYIEPQWSNDDEEPQITKALGDFFTEEIRSGRMKIPGKERQRITRRLKQERRKEN